MIRVRKLLSVLIAVLLAGSLPGCLTRSEASFAYVDEKSRVALYDLEAKKQVWVSELQIPDNVTPTWSPNGDALAYVSKDLAASKSYLVLLDVASRTERLVELTESAYKWSFDHGAEIKWAPVPRFISIHEHAAPPAHTTILDLDSGETLVR
jgi:hypothetical protein